MRRKSLDQVDGVLREGARRAAADHQQADDILSAQQRRYQQRAETGAQGDLVDMAEEASSLQVGDLDRLALREGLSDVRLIKADVLLRQRVNQLLIHAVGGAQMKFALHIVEDIDRASLGAGELHRLGDDGGEHGLEIERRVHRLRHFAERAQFADRAAKLIGALAQFVQQPRVLDRDDRLVGEVLDQLDLLVGEGRTS